jgi:hypothetical protein
MRRLYLFLLCFSMNVFGGTYTNGNWSLIYPEDWSTSGVNFGAFLGGPTPHHFWNDGKAVQFKLENGLLGIGQITSVSCPFPETDYSPNAIIHNAISSGTFLGSNQVDSKINQLVNQFSLFSAVYRGCHNDSGTVLIPEGEGNLENILNGHIFKKRFVFTDSYQRVSRYALFIDGNSTFVIQYSYEEGQAPANEIAEAESIINSVISSNPDSDLSDQSLDLFSDSDADGIPDDLESAWGGDTTSTDLSTLVSTINNLPADTDRDGIPDEYETAAGGDTTSSTFESVLAMLSVNKNVPAMGGIGLLALGLSMLGLGAVRSRKKVK